MDIGHGRIGLYLTVFRAIGSSDEEMSREYVEWAIYFSPLLPELDGFVSMKRFQAEDGEVCFIVEFRDETSFRAWSTHPLYIAAKNFGRTYFFSYDIKVCELRSQRSSVIA